MKTSSEYVESLRTTERRVFLLGEKIEAPNAHPMVLPSTRAVGLTYDLAQDDDHTELVTATSSLTGQRINRFTHLHQSTEDLTTKVKLLRLLGQKTGACFQRCVGWDALNALDSVTFEMDQSQGTGYHQRLQEFARHIQQNDLVCDGAMTDVKGDRSKPPSGQSDPDLYLRIVEERKGGIVVRGAKAHQTGAANCHEVIVMPTARLGEAEKEYAVSFAVPADTPGLTIIMGRRSCDMRLMEDGEIDVGNASYGGHEAIVVFDDVFVPWERVFMCREYAYAGLLVERFAAYHRQSYGGCKVGVGDVLIGAAATIAEFNGVEQSSHIRDKLIEMVHLNETLYACGLACSAMGQATASGTFLVDLILANVTKLNVTRMPYEIVRLMEDIAGGLLVTLPSEKDYRSAETGPYLEKYLKGREGVPTEHRLRMMRLIENLALGRASVGYRTESLHGAGSPQAQRIMIGRETDFEAKKAMARRLAGIIE